jgi:aminoglycoside phosphotransferase family enzyme/predicted kinase
MASLREELLDPGAYPSSEPGSIELIETHISWVFLVGSEVFKVKKPVDLGFLDFRTLEQRAAACRAELDLNRRLAASVYLDIVPIRRGHDGRIRVGGEEGTIVDWAVHMVRLPDRNRADHRLTRGEIGVAEIDHIAASLAAFHAEASTADAVSHHGSPAAIEASVLQNFEQMGDDPLRFITSAELAEIESFQRTFLRRERGRFEQRLERGRVRDGHGDLRLEHIYWGDRGDLRVIDCIEFSDRFRCVDVCADVAFLAMDLAFHGRVDLAERLVANYARHASDYDLYGVLDFYESYRAVVRAKVGMFLVRDEGASPEARAAAEHDVRRFLLLARSCPRPPVYAASLVAVGGLLASGKSTVADALGAAIGAPVVDADRTRKHLAGAPATSPMCEEPWQGSYCPAFSEKVYDELFRRAAVVLESGRPVILDASFRSRALRSRARDFAACLGVPYVFVECRASEARRHERLEAREQGANVSDGRLAIDAAFSARFEPVVEIEPSQHLVVDTERPIRDIVELVRARVGACPEGLCA